MIGDRLRVVEEDHQAVACEVLDRPAVGDGELADRAVVLAQHAQHLFRLGLLGKGGEAAQIGRTAL